MNDKIDRIETTQNLIKKINNYKKLSKLNSVKSLECNEN